MVAIKLQDVTVALQSGGKIQTVLADLDLQIESGSLAAVVGRNGSGKSTLARVIAGLSDISRGHISIFGEDIAHSNPLRVQLVFQNPEAQIIGETVYEDVAFGLANLGLSIAEIRDRTQRALRDVGLAVPLDQPVTALSGGQKQLLCIASCLALDADILLFDEATAMLDEGARQSLWRTVQRLRARGRTVLWFTQRLEELAIADRVIALESGRIVYDGDPRDFFYTLRDGRTSCAALGFSPPYVVQVAQRLRQRGVLDAEYPLDAKQLEEVLWRKCRSNSIT